MVNPKKSGVPIVSPAALGAVTSVNFDENYFSSDIQKKFNKMMIPS